MPLERKIAKVLGGHRHDLLTVEVDSPRGDFSLQLAADMEPRVWNIASSPPTQPDDAWPYEVLEVGSTSPLLRGGATYFVLETSVEEAETALDECRDIIERVGGSDARVTASETASMYHCTSSLVDPIVERIKGVFA